MLGDKVQFYGRRVPTEQDSAPVPVERIKAGHNDADGPTWVVWRWRYIALNGKNMANGSEEYNTRRDALSGALHVFTGQTLEGTGLFINDVRCIDNRLTVEWLDEFGNVIPFNDPDNKE